MFQGLELKLQALKYMFQDLEHKFQGLEHKFSLIEKNFSSGIKIKKFSFSCHTPGMGETMERNGSKSGETYDDATAPIAPLL